MHSSRFLYCVVLLAVGYGKVLVAQEPSSAIELDSVHEFTWFDRRFPPIAGRPFVRVVEDEQPTELETPEDRPAGMGFLLEEASDSFTLLSLDLLVVHYPKRTASTQSFDRVYRYHAEALERIVRTELERNGRPRSRATLDFSHAPHSDPVTFLVTLGWMCSKTGRDDLARLAHARASAARGHADPAGAQHLAHSKRIAVNCLWHAFLDHADAVTSRADFLARLEQVLDIDDTTRHTPRVRELAAVVKEMIVEDAQHRHPEQGAGAQIPTEVRIRDLIFHLRDQRGAPTLIPGSCTIFGPPADELVAIGLPAVPWLIEALDDLRPTRMIEDLRPFYFSHSLLRVGDAAVQILERIACRTFSPPFEATDGILLDGSVPSVRRRVEKWWKETQRAGEAEVLAIAVGAGGDDAGAAAERLLRLAPERALESIVAGAHATRSGDTRAGLVRTAATIESASSLTFLLSELKGPWLASRLAAAWELRARGRAEALPAMLNEWESLPDSASICLDFDVGRLARFLVAHADTATIARLEATYPHRPVGARAAMVSSLDGVGSDPAAATRFERLLTIALADRERFRGLHRSTRGPSSVEPRICDQAAEVLASAFPDRCRFTAEGVEARRDRDIRTMARDQFPRFRLVLPAELEETHARRVTVDANVPREEVLLRLCESVEGPLVADAEWTARLRRFFREVRTPCRRFELTISREAGDSSPIVRLLVVVGGEVPRLPTSSWSGCEVVFVDDQALVHSTWFGPLPWWRREEEFTTAVKEALSQPIERAIEIRLRVEESAR